MDISVEDFVKNSYVISIDDGIFRRFCGFFGGSGLPGIPRLVRGFKFNQNQFKADKFMKGLYRNGSGGARYGALGCGVSHAALVKYADLLGLDFITIFEDDARPCAGVVEKLGEYLTGIPDDCDILKLGWSKVYENGGSFGGKFNDKPKSWGTFAYMVFKKYYGRYFSNFEKSYISDHYVMSGSQVRVYHTKERLFDYHNAGTDSTIHSSGEKQNKAQANKRQKHHTENTHGSGQFTMYFA